MLPIFNPNPFQSSQLQTNGASPSNQQLMGANRGNFCPNPMQASGVMNPQLNQFAPFPFQGSSHLNPPGMNNNNPNNVNHFNAFQQMGQFLPQNSVIPAQLFNQGVNLGMPNGQWNMHNPLQNVNMNTNPLPQMAIPNLGQVFQGLGPQDLAFLASTQLSLLNAGVGNQMLNAGVQLQGNLGPTQAFNKMQQLQNQNQKMFSRAQSQANPGKAGDGNQTRGNWKKPHDKANIGNPKHDASRIGSMNSHFHQKQNAKGNFRMHKEHRGKGPHDGMARKPDFGKFSKQNQGEKKRPLLLSYTEQEVRQWREERRKNYPSKANLQKKQAEKVADPDETAKSRRQQLKEILAKQAELGCEVAEIPPSYLSDSEQLPHGRDGKRPFNKKETFQNKFNKRGKFHQNDRFAKRQRFGNPNSTNIWEQNDLSSKKQFGRSKEATGRGASFKREPTLLKKLLSADIRRDRQHLLQVLRFMMMNSFFKDWPEKALKFPSVLVKETENEGAPVEYEGNDELVDGDDDDDDNTNQVDKTEGPQEEEGEIID